MRFAFSPLNSVAIAVAVGLAAWTLRPLMEDSSFMAGVLPMLALAGALGAVGAALTLPRLLTLLGQAGGLTVFLGLRGLGIQPPTVETGRLESLGILASRGTMMVRDGSLPLPTSAELVWLILLATAGILVVVEVLVNVLEQPAWSIAPLGVLFGIGAIASPFEMRANHLLILVGGYLLVLLVATTFGASRGGRPDQVAGFHAWRSVVALVVGGIVVGLASATANMLPMGPKQPWLEAGSETPIQLSDPTVSLAENLRRPAEEEVLRYRTDSGNPIYLRTTALTRLTVDGAQLTPMQLTTAGLPEPSSDAFVEEETRVTMRFPSEYLPAPFAPTSYRADGRWAFDPDTLSIVATGEDRSEQTSDLEYRVTSAIPAPAAEAVDAATAAADPAGQLTSQVPDGLDPAVAQLTAEVVAGATTDGEKAQAIQSFLRSESFAYSLDAPDSTELDAISSFLLESRSGYCIHFAAAMTTMARIEGIPARMAVGFTPGTADGDDYVVTTHNLHTWPELYFEDLGWVPFEPTKSVASPPPWTDADAPSDDSASPSPEPSTPSATPSVQPPSPEPSPSPSAAPDEDEPVEGESSSGWWFLLSVLLLAGVPWGLRTLQRRWRLRPGLGAQEAAEGAWSEVRALYRDFRLPWDDSSPLLALDVLTRRLRPETAERLRELAEVVEKTRYARSGVEHGSLADDVLAIRQDLLQHRPGADQVRALFLPASLVPRR